VDSALVPRIRRSSARSGRGQFPGTRFQQVFDRRFARRELFAATVDCRCSSARFAATEFGHESRTRMRLVRRRRNRRGTARRQLSLERSGSGHEPLVALAQAVDLRVDSLQLTFEDDVFSAASRSRSCRSCCSSVSVMSPHCREQRFFRRPDRVVSVLCQHVPPAGISKGAAK
jgi:hypothetical protein